MFCITLALSLSLSADPLQQEVQSSLQSGVEAWNRGDLTEFMKGYVQGPDLTYTAGGKVVRGWDALYQRYRSTYGDNRASMGQLRFEEIETRALGDDYALAMGKWILEGKSRDSKVQGIFTLILHREKDGWKILHDHTSRLDEPKK